MDECLASCLLVMTLPEALPVSLVLLRALLSALAHFKQQSFVSVALPAVIFLYTKRVRLALDLTADGPTLRSFSS